MAVEPSTDDDASMPQAPSSPNLNQDFLAGAHDLQRAAGAVQQHTWSRDAVQSIPVAVAHFEEALDRLAIASLKMAHAVEDCGDGRREGLDENTLPPDAHALCWHLRAMADSLRASRDACAVSREWARRLLETLAQASGEVDAPDRTSIRPTVDELASGRSG